MDTANTEIKSLRVLSLLIIQTGGVDSVNKEIISLRVLSLLIIQTGGEDSVNKLIKFLRVPITGRAAPTFVS